jgi:hypothetical protein
MKRMDRLVGDLSGCPKEAVALALADAVFLLEDASDNRLELCLNEADAILVRLQHHGFDIVKK